MHSFLVQPNYLSFFWFPVHWFYRNWYTLFPVCYYIFIYQNPPFVTPIRLIISLIGKKPLSIYSHPLLYFEPEVKWYPISLHIIFMSKKIFSNLKGYKDLLFSGYCYYPADIDMFKVNSRNTSTRCEICSRLTIKTPERRQWRRSGVFIGNFKHISHLVLLFLLLTLSS